jgi:hypothetical protein
MHLNFIGVLILYYGHQQVSATPVPIFGNKNKTYN